MGTKAASNCPGTIQQSSVLPSQPAAARQRAERQASGAEDVVKLERLVDLVEPLGAVGGAAAAAFIKRQLQLAQQARHLFPCRDMAKIGPGPKRRLVDIVECSQAARAELSVDHTRRK